jgi:hypothetical protein
MCRWDGKEATRTLWVRILNAAHADLRVKNSCDWMHLISADCLTQRLVVFIRKQQENNKETKKPHPQRKK